MRFLTVFAAIGLSAQEVQDVQQLIDLARATPPEMAAGALVLVAPFAAKDKRKQLVEDAFEIASQAKQPERMRLQADALRRMLDLDVTKAREMFQRFERASVKTNCTDEKVPSLDGWYDIAREIAARSYSAKEKLAQDDFRFLLSTLASAGTIPELNGALRLFTADALPPDRLQAVAATIAGRIDGVETGDRAFAVTFSVFSTTLETIAEAVVRAASSPEPLRRATRGYVVRNLAGGQCAAVSSVMSREAVAWFNDRFRGGLPAITEDEIKSSKRPKDEIRDTKDEKPDAPSTASDIGAALRKLRFDELGRVRTDLASTEWRRELAEFMRTVDSVELRFAEKADLWRSLLGMTPAGEDRDKVLQRAVLHLAGSDTQRESFPEWMLYVKRLEENAPSKPQVRNLFKASGDVSLTVHALLEELLERQQ